VREKLVLVLVAASCTKGLERVREKQKKRERDGATKSCVKVECVQRFSEELPPRMGRSINTIVP
jgi:hypothetical protein